MSEREFRMDYKKFKQRANECEDDCDAMELCFKYLRLSAKDYGRAGDAVIKILDGIENDIMF